MPLDFTPVKDKLPEGLTVELLASPVVQDFIQTFTTSSVDTATQGLKTTNEALKGEKTDIKSQLEKFKDVDLEEYTSLKELKNNDINLDEYAALQKFKADNTDAATQLNNMRQQMKTMEDAYKEKLDVAGGQVKEAGSLLLDERRTNQINHGISGHNATHEALSVLSGNERWIQQEAKDVWKYQEGADGAGGRFVAMNDDQLIAGKDGKPVSMSEWVGTLRDAPNFKHMFSQPSGGGAGGGGAGGPSNTDKSKLLGSKSEAASVVSGMFPELAN